MTEPAKAQGKGGQDDLAILFPERRSVIGDMTITMREYTLVETLDHHRAIAAFADAITDIALAGNFADLDSLRSAFGECRDHVLELIAAACDQPVAWVRSLSADDGEALMMLWWGVNAHFFLRRVLLSVQLRKVREFDGRTSSAPSSPTDTTLPPSAATPNAS